MAFRQERRRKSEACMPYLTTAPDLKDRLSLKERLSTIRPRNDGAFVLTRDDELFVASQAEVVEAMVLVGAVDDVFDYVKRLRQLLS
jgi:hypothetical protein